MTIKTANKTKKAFTLIETIVAVSILSTVMLTITGIFSSVMKAQRQMLGMQDVQNSARFLLESLSRELRMAIIDEDGTCITAGQTFEDPAGNGLALSFLNYKHECVRYSWGGPMVGGPLSKTVTVGADTTTLSLTENNLVLEALHFYVRDNRAAGAHPFVSFFIALRRPNTTDDEQSIKIQSSLSARSY
ncbi:MAG: prepilin-type N-terminal cleavage/methylation domain-containing protein [bacterium]